MENCLVSDEFNGMFQTLRSTLSARLYRSGVPGFTEFENLDKLLQTAEGTLTENAAFRAKQLS